MPPIPVVASFCGGAATLDRGCHISSIVGFVLFVIELILASIIASYHEARVTPNIIGSIVGVAACVLLILGQFRQWLARILVMNFWVFLRVIWSPPAFPNFPQLLLLLLLSQLLLLQFTVVVAAAAAAAAYSIC